MAIGRNFTEALQKAIRMVGEYGDGFMPDFENKNKWKLENLDLGNKLKAHNKRISDIFNILYFRLIEVEEISNLSGIDKWFIHQIKKIVDCFHLLENQTELNSNLIMKCKKNGLSDKQILIFLKLQKRRLEDLGIKII